MSYWPPSTANNSCAWNYKVEPPASTTAVERRCSGPERNLPLVVDDYQERGRAIWMAPSGQPSTCNCVFLSRSHVAVGGRVSPLSLSLTLSLSRTCRVFEGSSGKGKSVLDQFGQRWEAFRAWKLPSSFHDWSDDNTRCSCYYSLTKGRIRVSFGRSKDTPVFHHPLTQMKETSD